ncbi:MAG: hypothetical protein ABFC96_13750 [Thermoguttaceae bacterium]
MSSANERTAQAAVRCPLRSPREAARHIGHERTLTWRARQQRWPASLPRLLLPFLAAWPFVLTGGPALGQETLLSVTLRENREQCGFNIVDGRFAFRWTEARPFQRSSGPEKLRLRYPNGQPKLTYERTIRDVELLKFEMSGGGNEIHISRTPHGTSKVVTLDFRQVPREPITFTWGVGGSRQTLHAASLWRLLIELPSETQKQLLPLLDALRPDEKLADTLTEIERRLCQEANGKAGEERSGWAALVRQLGDDSFARREAADRQLRTGNPSLLAYLRGLELGRLDAEQRFRIRRILDAAAAQNDEDSPQQIAATLSGDSAVWLALLARPDSATRQAAARRLRSLAGGPIGVDPAEDPETQKAKREQLRQRLEKK